MLTKGVNCSHEGTIRIGNYSITQSIVSWSLFLLVFLSIVNGALPQVEMLIFSGRCPIPSIFLKLCILILFVASQIMYSNLKIKKTATLTLLVLFSFLAFETGFFSISSRIPIIVTIFGFDTMYSLLIVSLLVANIHSTISAKDAERFVLIVAIPILLLGISQTMLNSPIVPLRSIDDYFQVLVWNYYGQVRAFSFFEAPAYYATFLVFLGSFALSTILSRAKSPKKLFFGVLLIYHSRHQRSFLVTLLCC